MKLEHFFLFENASDPMVVFDLHEKKITDANKAMRHWCGMENNKLSQFDLNQLSPTSSEVEAQFSTHGRSKPLEASYFENAGLYEDLCLKTSQKKIKYISLSVQVLEHENQKISLCVLRDIEEKRKMERELLEKHSELRAAFLDLEKKNVELKATQEALIQSGKLAALGELAAGIAHELNQPLTVIKGFAQEALVEPQNQKTVSIALKEIDLASTKMNKIISHLRNFARKSTEDFRQVNVNTVLSDSFLLLQKQFEIKGIKIEKKLDSKPVLVFCDPFQLEQVFVNLATNARDAIEQKKEKNGKIIIQTKAVDEKMIEVIFEDNGCGIPEELKDKVFNPFFTTKEVGKGTGLGLSISYGILSRLNASVVVESKQGNGSKFILKIPADYRKH